MINKRYIALILTILITFVSGCKNTEEDTQKSNNYNKIYTSLEEKFSPPNFEIESFQIGEEKGKLKFKIKYKLSSKLKRILQHNDNKYYLQLEYSDFSSRLLDIESSVLIKGDQVATKQSIYETVIFCPLPENITDKDRKNILKNKKNYGLYIYDHEYDPVHYFDDIELLSTAN